MTASQLREFRAKHNLTQDELGEILGKRVDRRMVSKYEKGILTLASTDVAKLFVWEASRDARDFQPGIGPASDKGSSVSVG